MDRADIEADDALNRSFTRQEIVLLARYSVAKAALQYLRPWFLVKYAVFVLVFILLVLADGDRFVQGVAGFLVVVGLMLLLGQSLIRRLLVRLGGFRRLARFDAIVDETWTG